MTVVLLGSHALNKHIAGFRTPVDTDLVCDYDALDDISLFTNARAHYPNSDKTWFMKSVEYGIIDIEVAWPDSRGEKLLEFVKNDPHTQTVRMFGKLDVLLPSLNVLYMLKMSHRYLKDSPHFLKTMQDIRKLRKRGAIIQDDHQAFYEQRMKDTYVYKHPNLKVDKDTFFDAVATGVEYTYDHDSIHEAIKTMNVPAYTMFAEPGEQVKSSKEIFFQCDQNVRLRAVMEEAMVLAIERSLVPFPGKKTPKEAFDFALSKVCTSITSGWFREFAWEHYDDVQLLFAFYNDYFEQFQKGLDEGIVKPYTGSTYNTGEEHV